MTYQPPPSSSFSTTARRLHRCVHEPVLGGVAAGVAEELGLDPWLVRLGFAVAATAGGLGLPLYLLAWLLLPAEDTGESIAEQLLAPERPAA